MEKYSSLPHRCLYYILLSLHMHKDNSKFSIFAPFKTNLTWA
jgi:hypothetical protein